MSTRDLAPREHLEQLARSEATMRAAVAPLAQADVTVASPLPGWSIAHVLSHIARNADSHVRRIEAARRHEVIDQYPGGLVGRDHEIDQGATRSARTIVDDVIATSLQLDAAWSRLVGDEWLGESRDATGQVRDARGLPSRRLQEVEVHLLDLDIDASARDWSDVFVAVFLPQLRSTMTDRVPTGRPVPTAAELGALDGRDELAWLYGRVHISPLPDLLPLGTTHAGPPRG